MLIGILGREGKGDSTNFLIPVLYNDTVLANGNILQLATSYAADRKGKVYKDKIIPDVFTGTNKITHDDTIEAAKNWLCR